MRILDQKSPRENVTRILPKQLHPKDHQEIPKLQETNPGKYDALTGKPI